MQFLLKVIKATDNSAASAEIYVTLTSLLAISKNATITYFDTIIKFISEDIQDMSLAPKRVQALKCLASAVSNSGFVIYMYYKHSNLVDSLFELFGSDTNSEIKIQILRVFGCFGAIDPFILRKINKDDEYSGDNLTLETAKLMKRNHKVDRFHFEDSFNEDFRSGEENRQNIFLKDFFDNLMVLNQIIQVDKTVPTARETYDNLFRKPEIEHQQTVKMNNLPDSHLTIDEKTNELLKFPDIISLNNRDDLLNYITLTTFKALLQDLVDDNLRPQHDSVISALTRIINKMRREISLYLYI
jgi:hypothetical protein